MRRFLLQSIIASTVSAIVGAAAGYLLTEGLPEGAVMGGLLGGSLGLLIAARRQQGASGPAFELEAAGLHDDNLTTIARRKLGGENHRDAFRMRAAVDEKIESLASRDQLKRQ